MSNFKRHYGEMNGLRNGCGRVGEMGNWVIIGKLDSFWRQDGGILIGGMRKCGIWSGCGVNGLDDIVGNYREGERVKKWGNLKLCR